MGIFIKDLSAEGMTYQEYLGYIEANKDKLTKEAYCYAMAEWHYKMDDPRCIHDAWLVSSVIKEASVDEPSRKA